MKVNQKIINQKILATGEIKLRMIIIKKTFAEKIYWNSIHKSIRFHMPLNTIFMQ